MRLLILIARDEAHAAVTLFVYKTNRPVAVPFDLEQPFVVVKRLINQCRQHRMDHSRHRALHRALYLRERTTVCRAGCRNGFS